MKECLGCKYLGHCSLVTQEKLLARFICPRWDEEIPEVVAARAAMVRQFGNVGVRILVKPPKED